MDPQKAQQSSPSLLSYRVSFVSILKKNYRIMKRIDYVYEYMFV